MVIIAGANGSGKTTFARSYSTKYPLEFINADEAARKINPGDMYSARLEAGRYFFKKFEELLQGNESFLVESTLAGQYLVKLIRRLKENGFFVKILYLFLENPDICIERIKERVLKGGHNVPEKDVIRRFYRSKKNFWNKYKNLADVWFLVYNSEHLFTQVALGSQDDYVIDHRSLFNKFMQDIEE